jgi:hypothetical protein
MTVQYDDVHGVLMLIDHNDNAVRVVDPATGDTTTATPSDGTTVDYVDGTGADLTVVAVVRGDWFVGSALKLKRYVYGQTCSAAAAADPNCVACAGAGGACSACTASTDPAPARRR